MGAAVSDYVRGNPPLKKLGDLSVRRARARGSRGGGYCAPRPQGCLADVASRAQDFPSYPDWFHVPSPEGGGSRSPTRSRFPESTQLGPKRASLPGPC